MDNEKNSENKNSRKEKISRILNEILFFTFVICEIFSFFLSTLGYLFSASPETILYSLSHIDVYYYLSCLVICLILNIIPIAITAVKYFLEKDRFRMYLAMTLFTYFFMASTFFLQDGYAA